MTYVYLFIAIVAEVIATSSLKASESFTRLWPAVITLVGYAIAFYFLTLVLRTMPTGIAYAIWSGVGIVLISAVGWVVFKQKLDLPAIIGLGLIIAGVLVVNLFSNTVGTKVVCFTFSAVSASLSATTPPVAAAISGLLPLSPPIWNSSAWMTIRMR